MSHALPPADGARRVRASRLRFTVALAASLSLAAPARAVDQGSDPLPLDRTVAERMFMRNWDNSQRYGAETVSNRDRRQLQPDGLRAGNFMVFPTLGTTVVFDDNVYATSKNRTADVSYQIVPVVVVRSELPRHVFDFATGAKFTQHVNHGNLDTADAFFNAGGGLHFDNSHTLAFNLLSEFNHEDLASSDAPKNAIEATPYFHNRATVGLKRDAGRLYASIGSTFERWDYQDVRARDGSIINQSERDKQLVSAQTTVGYRFSPGFEFNTKFRALRQMSIGHPVLDKSATGYEALAGLTAQLNPLVRWHLLGGYGIRDFDSTTIGRSTTSMFEAGVQWLPTQLMTISANAKRGYSEGVDSDGGGARIDTVLNTTLQYEVLRNLVFTLGGEYAIADYLADPHRARSIKGRIGAEYYYTKNILFSMTYEHTVKRSDVADENFERNRIWLGAKLRF